jgi:hypothetical protein
MTPLPSLRALISDPRRWPVLVELAIRSDIRQRPSACLPVSHLLQACGCGSEQPPPQLQSRTQTNLAPARADAVIFAAILAFGKTSAHGPRRTENVNVETIQLKRVCAFRKREKVYNVLPRAGGAVSWMQSWEQA